LDAGEHERSPLEKSNEKQVHVRRIRIGLGFNNSRIDACARRIYNAANDYHKCREQHQ
jgi:hypothetical protein